MEYKEFLGAAGVLISLIAYAIYFRDIFWRGTKPHAFSWLVWAILGGIAFAAQTLGGAGAGSWVIFVDTIACSCFFILALFKGEKSYTTLDWASLVLAFFSLLLWWITKSPTLSVLLITLVEVFAFVPTYRKSFHKPFEESASLFIVGTVKYTASFFALSVYSIDTAFYVGALVFINAIFVMMLLLRRRQLSNEPTSQRVTSSSF